MSSTLITNIVVLAAIVVCISVVAVVGHTLWMILGSILRALTGSFGRNRDRAATDPRPQPMICPICASVLRSESSGCPHCQWRPDSVTASRPLEVALAEVERLSQNRLIDSATFRIVSSLLRHQLRKLRPYSDIVVAQVSELRPMPDLQPTATAPPVRAPDEVTGAGTAHAPSLSPAERVTRYMAKSTQDSGVAPTEIPASSKPERQPWGAWMSAFMEEKHIRWGELVGGLLIVSCSIALVISFWSKIAERPILKFGIFNGLTAGLFGLGLQAAKRWKLPTTSQGILLISMLLVPLNFLAIAAFTEGAMMTSIPVFVGEAVSVVGFTALVYLAAGVVQPNWAAIVTVGIIGQCLLELLVRRLVSPGASPSMIWSLGIISLAGYAVANGCSLRVLANEPELSERRGNELLKMLGLTSFAAILVAGLLLFKSGQPAHTLQLLSPLAGIAALPALAVGMTLAGRVNAALAGMRTLGFSIAVFGSGILIGGLVSAWPQPAVMLPTAIIGTLAIWLIAVRYRVPEAHLGAAPCATLAYLLIGLTVSGQLEWRVPEAGLTLAALTSALSGKLLIGLAAVYGTMAWCWHAAGRSDETKYHGWIAFAIAVGSLGLVTWRGFLVPGDPAGATGVYGLYSAIALAGACVVRRRAATWVGGGLLLATCIQAIVFRYSNGTWVEPVWLAALLVHSSLMCVIAIAVYMWDHFLNRHEPSESMAARPDRIPGELRRLLVEPASDWSLISACLGLGVIAAIGWHGELPSALMIGWLAMIWLALAYVRLWPELFVMFQVTLTACVVLAVDDQLRNYTWYSPQAESGWYDPRSLQWQGIALGVLSLVWIGLRAGLRRSTSTGVESIAPAWKTVIHQLMYTYKPSIDQLVASVVVVLLGLLAGYAALPGFGQELSVHHRTANRLVPDATSFEVVNIPHGPAKEVASWVLLVTVTGVLIAGLRERSRTITWCGFVIVALSAAWLLAARWEPQVAVASAWRWSTAGLFCLLSIYVWCRPSVTVGSRPSEEGANSIAFEKITSIAGLLVILAALPTILVGNAVLVSLTGGSEVGPEPGSFFARVGPAVSYALPLALVAIFTVGNAVRKQSAGLAFAAGLVFNLSGSAAFLLADSHRGFLPFESWLNFAQWNAIMLAGFALGWIACVELRRRGSTARRTMSVPLQFQIAFSTAMAVISLIPVFLLLFFEPATTQRLEAVAGWWGWSAVLLTTAALAFYREDGWRYESRSKLGRVPVATWGIGLSLIVIVVACEIHRWDALNWLSYHTLLAGFVFVGCVMLLVGWMCREQQDIAIAWTSFHLAITAGLSLRAVFHDPQHPWWAVGGFVAASGLSALQATASVQRRFMYLAAALSQTAANVWWLDIGHRLLPASDFWSGLLRFVDMNLIALCLPAILWRWIDSQWLVDRCRVTNYPTIHRLAATLGLIGLTVQLALALLCDAAGWSIPRYPVMAWMAMASVGAAVAVCLRDREARLAIFGLYIVGLLLVASAVDQLNLTLRPLVWSGTILLAAYSVCTSYLWSRRKGLAQMARQPAIPIRSKDQLAGQTWLVSANCWLAAAVVFLGFWVQLTFQEPAMRLVAAQAIIAQTCAVGMLARGEQASSLRDHSLWLGVLGAIALGWSGLNPATTGTFLHQTAVVAAALGGMAVLYGLGLIKLLRRENDWTRAAARLVPAISVWTLVAIVVLLTGEAILYWWHGRIEMAWPAIVTVAITLIGLAGACLIAALIPGRDPWGLSERQRQVYVYVVEGLLAALFVHVRLTMPWLFSGFFQRFWPFVVMFVAFVGVGLSEFFRRRRRTILAVPLERTGALLPLLPMIGYWVAPSNVHYSPLMLTVGIIYGALSVLRRSFFFGVLAACALNSGLWFLLHDTHGLGILRHPQLWLIPPAMCVLIAAYINRRQLDDARMTTIRYLCATTIYASSTADIFLNGVAEAPWLPFVLAGLSIAGIAAGIALRVRAFLFLGTSFLGLALMTVIWFAAVDLEQTWLWFVAGVGVGIAIYAVFAIFEKKRHEVLALVERLKTWEA